MIIAASVFALILSNQSLAQLSTPQPTAAPVAPAAAATVDSGPCEDSPRAVPLVLQPPAGRTQQIVRIDKIVSTQTNLSNEVIGYLYTLQDGTTWLGQRLSDYMSAADAKAINAVLSASTADGKQIAGFPPQTRYGVPTKYQEFFRVNLIPQLLGPLQIRVDPCVAWPPGRPLPDPHM
jgi:hypothetical protein